MTLTLSLSLEGRGEKAELDGETVRGLFPLPLGVYSPGTW